MSGERLRFQIRQRQQLMSDCPMWKRVGVYNSKNRTEGTKSPCDRSSYRDPSSSQGTQKVASGDSKKGGSQYGSKKEQSFTRSNNHKVQFDDEAIFQNCINKFKEASLKSSGLPCERAVTRQNLGPIREVEISDTNISKQNNAKDRRIRNKMNQLAAIVASFREMVVSEKQQISFERAQFQDSFRVLSRKLRESIASLPQAKELQESSAQTDKSAHFKISKHEQETQVSQGGHEDLLYVRTSQSLKRKDITRSQAKSENQQQRDRTTIENLELRQEIDMLKTTNQMLESRIEYMRAEYQNEQHDRQQARQEDLEGVYASNKTLMKQTIEKYMQQLFSKDHIISRLKAQLNQKTEELAKMQTHRAEAVNLVVDTGLGSIYTRRYKQLYEKVETQRLKLRTDLDSAIRQKQDIKAELDSLREQSGNVVHENIELIQKVQDISMDSNKKMNDMKACLNRQFKNREFQLSKEISSLKAHIQQKDQKIELLDRLIAKNKQNNASIKVEDRSSNLSEYSDQVESPRKFEPKCPPTVLQSIRSLPGNNSPSYKHSKIVSMRQTIQDVVTRKSEIRPESSKIQRKPSQPYGRSSLGLIKNDVKRQSQGQSRQLSKYSGYNQRVCTERGPRDNLHNITQGPMTPNLPKRRSNERSSDYQRKSLTEQVETLSFMMKNQLMECGSLRKGL